MTPRGVVTEDELENKINKGKYAQDKVHFKLFYSGNIKS